MKITAKRDCNRVLDGKPCQVKAGDQACEWCTRRIASDSKTWDGNAGSQWFDYKPRG
jgi:hypothetical protein